MPWKPGGDNLPKNVKKLSKKRQKQWSDVANSALERGMSDGQAIRMANGVVKKQVGHSTAAGRKEMPEQKIEAGQKAYWGPGQLTQDEAGYDPYGAANGQGCASCRWYVPDMIGCVVVSGAIVATGKSDRYEAISDSEDLGDESLDVAVGMMGSDEPKPAFLDRLLGFIGLKQPEPSDPEPQPETQFSFQLKELPDGRLRYLCVSSNNYEDREHQTIPAYAHKEYVEWVEQENAYPELWPWHMGGLRLGVADYLAFDGNFLISSGLIDQGMEAKAKAWADDPDTAMSHGFLKKQIDDDIVKYREFEQSVLPLWAAANPFTDFSVGVKDMALTPKKRAELASKGYTDDELEAMDSWTNQFRKRLADAGIAFKDLADDGTPAGDPAPAAAGDPPAADPAPAAAPSGAFSLDDLRAVIREEFDSRFEASTKELRDDIAALKGSEDERFSNMWRQRANLAASNRPSQSDETRVEEGQGVAASQKEFKPGQKTEGPWINNLPIFQHPAFLNGAGTRQQS